MFPKRKSKRVILVAMGDKHAGNEGALVNPEAEIPVLGYDEDGTRVVETYENPSLSPIQARFWKWHEADRQSVSDLAGKDPIIYIGMGDETQGPVFRDDLKQVDISTQLLMSYHNMLPWLDMPQVKAAYFTKGTPVHVWGPAGTETLLTHSLQLKYPNKRIGLTHHWLLRINGLTADIAHHGPGPGIREWTKGNVLRLYVRSLMLRLALSQKDIPSLLLRAHFHSPVQEIVTLNLERERFQTEAWICPPYCFPGAHAIKVTQSVPSATVGMLVFEIVDGKLYRTYDEFMHTYDLKVEDEINL